MVLIGREAVQLVIWPLGYMNDYLKNGRGGSSYRLSALGRAGPEQGETVLLLLVSGQGFHSSEVRMCLDFTLALD